VIQWASLIDWGQHNIPDERHIFIGRYILVKMLGKVLYQIPQETAPSPWDPGEKKSNYRNINPFPLIGRNRYGR
jgi:hypothetical protein